MHTTDQIDALARALRRSATGAVVLTGAGVSLPSGIPAFRSSPAGDGAGIWERYDPMEYATLAAFRRDPEKVWGFLRELDQTLRGAAPNPAHHALAELERRGLVQLVVTQNVDGLHQAAGSRGVVELHGSAETLSCIACGAEEHRSSTEQRTPPDDPAWVPRCLDCGGVLKPDVVFFGEELPRGAYQQADHAARTTDLLLVVGTSAEVEPAASLPTTARRAGAVLWEVNPEPAVPGAQVIAGRAEEVLPDVVDRALGRGPVTRWLARRRRGA